MKSKTAQAHIDSLDFWVKVGENRQTLVVHFSVAEKAIEMAEDEMKQKAIETHRKCCPNLSKDNDLMCKHLADCDRKCLYMTEFINHL